MPALQLTADDHLSRRVDAVDLKHRFSNVETDRRDRLHAWLPHNRDRPSGDHSNGTYVPAGKPSTASQAARSKSNAGLQSNRNAALHVARATRAVLLFMLLSVEIAPYGVDTMYHLSN